eukprot:gene2311-biopygen1942
MWRPQHKAPFLGRFARHVPAAHRPVGGARLPGWKGSRRVQRMSRAHTLWFRPDPALRQLPPPGPRRSCRSPSHCTSADACAAVSATWPSVCRRVIGMDRWRGCASDPLTAVYILRSVGSVRRRKRRRNSVQKRAQPLWCVHVYT